MLQPSTNENFVVPAGYVFVDREDADGNLTGERYIGQTPGFAITVETPDQVELYSSDGPIAELLDQVVTRVARSGTMQTQNIDLDNLAAFLIAETEEASTEAGSVTDEAIAGVRQGRWYQLGVDDTNPAGVRNVENVVVEDDQATAFTEGTDYELDAELARIYIVPGGGITDDTSLVVDYDTLASTWDRIRTADSGAVYAAVRVIADNTAGQPRDYYLPRVQLSPSGELSLKDRENYQSMTFNLALQQRQVNGVKRAQIYVDGRPAV